MEKKYLQSNKFRYLVKIMDLKGDTESKKHGYYKILNIGKFILSWDSRNGDYYLKDKEGHLNIDDYLEIIYKICTELYSLPSLKPEKCLWELLDRLYLTNPEIKTIYDKLN